MTNNIMLRHLFDQYQNHESQDTIHWFNTDIIPYLFFVPIKPLPSVLSRKSAFFGNFFVALHALLALEAGRETGLRQEDGGRVLLGRAFDPHRGVEGSR